MKTHTVWVVITVSYFIFTSAAVHTRSNQPILSVKPQASNVARSLTQPATPTVMPTRQIRPGALGLPDATVFGAVGRWEPVRNDSAGPGRRAAFRSSRRATAGPDRSPRGFAVGVPGAAGRVFAIDGLFRTFGVSPNVSRFDAPCHVAHVGRRVANTGGDARRSGAVIQPVALQSTAPPYRPIILALVVIQPVALAARLCVTGQASRTALRIVRYLRWR
jgi:hypothetical protein